TDAEAPRPEVHTVAGPPGLSRSAHSRRMRSPGAPRVASDTATVSMSARVTSAVCAVSGEVPAAKAASASVTPTSTVSMASERLRQAQRGVRDARQNQVVADRSGAGQTRLAPLALDAVLLGRGVTAEGVEGGVGGGPQRLGGEELGAVDLEARVLAGGVHLGGAPAHERSGLQLRVGAGERHLDGLVLADLAAEDLALVGVLHRAVEQVEAGADVLARDDDALGVHARDDDLEALALFADAVRDGHAQVTDGELVGLV